MCINEKFSFLPGSMFLLEFWSFNITWIELCVANLYTFKNLIYLCISLK